MSKQRTNGEEDSQSKRDQPPRLSRQLTSQFDLSQDYEDQVLITSTSTFLPDEEEGQVKVDVGTATNIGGGHVNQDRFMCFRSGENNEHLVMGVFDGHGRELGELAAESAMNFMKEQLQKTECLSQLEEDPKSTFEALFEGAHQCVKNSFIKACEQNLTDNWEVVEDPLGFLIKRQRREKDVLEMNVHGGSTATVVVILNSETVVCANVGDSSALFASVVEGDQLNVKHLTADHSPENLEEYKRVKQNAPQDTSLRQNDINTLRFVYDAEAQDFPKPKYFCPPIFELEHDSGICKKTSKIGSYYKNVRSEWATLVSAPPTAKFQDALAFTRSLGDLHLHVYGVCHSPEVNSFPIKSLLGSGAHFGFLLLCTDGVWDNWRHEDLVKTTFDLYFENQNMQHLTDSLMERNLLLAQKYFGSQADNMTAVLCSVSFPTLDN